MGLRAPASRGPARDQSASAISPTLLSGRGEGSQRKHPSTPAPRQTGPYAAHTVALRLGGTPPAHTVLGVPSVCVECVTATRAALRSVYR